MTQSIRLAILGCALLHVGCVDGSISEQQPALSIPVPAHVTVRRHDVSPPLRDMTQLPPNYPEGVPRPPPEQPPAFSGQPDEALQNESGEGPAIGYSSVTNGIAGTAGILPPDPNASVGTTQIVETVNRAYQVFDKTSGASQLGPSAITGIWIGFGGLCELHGTGDPIVLFDKAASRWFITQAGGNSGTPEYSQCIAVSTTADATGSYERYEFSFGTFFNDYGKFGVWGDAYYATYNMIGACGGTDCTRVCAYERARMLSGNPNPRVSCRDLPATDSFLLPADLDGSTAPPAGAPSYLVGIPFGSTSTLYLFKYHVDFQNDNNSTLTGPTSITVASFSSGDYSAAQLGTTQTLHVESQLLQRLAYRNFGDHESLVACHSVNLAGSGPGVRWYELRNPTAPTVYQQGTYAPDTRARFNCSAAMDGAGDIALGYSVSSSSIYPAIRMTSRFSDDALGTMREERSLMEGGGSQLQGPNPSYSTRWGDYSSMAIDPVDDTTFVHTNEYYAVSHIDNWRTRISQFKLNAFSSTGNLVGARYWHTGTLLPSGKVLVAGGYASGVNLQTAELYDPATGAFTATTGNMTTARVAPSATLLPNGKVLIAGGLNGTSLSTAELFDPATGTFAATAGSMPSGRQAHKAVLLPNGKVLLVGGANGSTYLSSCLLYTPSTGLFTTTGSMGTARAGHSVTLLPSGKVLVAGGYNPTNGYLTSAELYDPVAGTFTSTGSISTAKYWHTATLLPNGKVLLAGGQNATGFLSSTYLYDPATGVFTLHTAMQKARIYHSATLLPTGNLFIAGGYNETPSPQALGSGEIYNPATGTFTSAAKGLITARYIQTAMLLRTGKVLLAGGTSLGAIPLNTAELYDSGYSETHGAFVSTGNMTAARSGQTATELPNGKVLVAGGYNGSSYLSSAELYNPATRAFTSTGSLGQVRSQHTATLLRTGKVLVVGGFNGSSYPLTGELYDPATSLFTNTVGSLTTGRSRPTATLLPDGKVLIAGGYNGSYLSTAVLYDPATGNFTSTGNMGTARGGHTATLLPNGKVLITGGFTGTTYLSSALLYDPATGAFTSTGSMGTARYAASATLLANGTVLVAGGADTSIPPGIIASAEIYTPATGLFTPTSGSLNFARYLFATTLLPNGRVLVSGGNATPYPTVAELFNPSTGTFETTSAFVSTGRASLTSTFLSTNGRVLITGGASESTTQQSGELYY